MGIMGLDSVSSLGGQTNSAQKQVMGKDDFLQLLVAQLQAQDPLNPMDSTEFTAQLAQFSSLEQLQNINGSLDNIGTSQSVLTNSQAVSFIGKEVTAVGNSVYVQNAESVDMQFNLNQDAAAVHIKVYDADGNFIRSFETGPKQAGQNSATWDAVDYLGGHVPDGAYSYDVMAVDADGNAIGATTFTSGLVTGVNYKNGQAYLLTEQQEIPMGNVVQVKDHD
jgi:flagellar basal-body rod modification protein FlgD